MAPVVTALDHIQLPVRDLSEAVTWYRDVLGFQLLTDYGAYAMLRLEPALDLMLWEAQEYTPMRVALDGEIKPVFFLKSTALDELARRLERAEAAVSSAEDLGFARVRKFSDPSGNLLGAIEFAAQG